MHFDAWRQQRANERVLRQRDHVIRTLVLRRFVGSAFTEIGVLSIENFDATKFTARMHDFY